MNEKRSIEDAVEDYYAERRGDIDARSEQELVRRVIARAAESRPHRRRWTASTLLAGVACLAIAGGLVLRDASSEGAREVAGSGHPSPTSAATDSGRPTDCLSAFMFQGKAYALALGSNLQVAPAGEAVGTGTYETCDDGGGQTSTDPRPAYSFVDVPDSQAIILAGPEGGSVLIALERPSDGWDPDLASWMKSSGVREP